MYKYEINFYTEDYKMKTEWTNSWFAFMKLRLTTRWHSYRINRH
ncbi:hypothetical protein [Psychrobacillus sp. FSL H8-0510]